MSKVNKFKNGICLTLFTLFLLLGPLSYFGLVLPVQHLSETGISLMNIKFSMETFIPYV